MDKAFVELLEDNAEHAERFQDSFDEVQESQHPDVVTVCCSDSRVLQDHMWGNDRPGRIFTVGNIGNRVVQATEEGEAVSGDVLYPIAEAGARTVAVVGHTGCGAITATYDAMNGGSSELPGIDHCIRLLGPRLEPGVDALPPNLDRAEAIDRLVEYNVDRQVAFLRESEDVPEEVDVVGVVYDFQDVYSGRRGEVHVVNVDGVTDVEALRDEHPEVRSRIERLWTY